MFPRTFFDLTSHPGGQDQFPEKTEEVLSQVIWIRALRCLAWGRQRGQEARVSRYTPSTAVWLDSEVDKECCRSFLGSRIDTAAGKDGSEFRGNRQLFLVCSTETPCLQCLHWFVTSFLYAPLPSQLKQTGWDESATTWLTHRFYCSFQTPCALFTVNSQNMTQITGADIILDSTLLLFQWENQINQTALKYSTVCSLWYKR